MEERYLPDEPQGWRELRAIMQQERDPERLAVLVSETNIGYGLDSMAKRSQPIEL